MNEWDGSDWISEEADEIDEIDTDMPMLYQHTAVLADVGARLDKLAATVFQDFSRASLQKYIESGQLTLNNQPAKTKTLVQLGDTLTLFVQKQAHSHDQPENIPLDIVYEDEAVLVINKPAGRVVHPGAGNWTGTLVNALLYHYPTLAHLPRAGLVHRIDKDTTGLLIIAKTAKAQLALIDQLKDKSVYRHYQCVVWGNASDIAPHKIIDKPIGRHLTKRTQMAIRPNGKPAITHIQNITPLGGEFCLLDVALQTGRTHQIRVHLSSCGFALVGDRVYGKRPKKVSNPTKQAAVAGFMRQALHAHTLGFVHPMTQKNITVHCPLPDDMRALIAILQAD